MLRKLLYGLGVGALAALLSVGLWLWGALDGWENATWTWRVRTLARPSAATAKIKVILVDQASLDWGRKENSWAWPWPREVLGVLLGFCQRGGAKAVAFDVMYTEPSFYGVGDDQAFGKAIGEGAPFVAATMTGSQDGDATSWPAGLKTATPAFEGLGTWGSSPLKTPPRATFPIPEVANAASMLGTIRGVPDPDGVYRRSPAFQVFDGRVLPSLGLAAYLAGQQRAGRPATVRVEPGWLTLDGARLPLDDQGRALLRFAGPVGTYEELSAAAVFQSEMRLREGGQPTLDPALLKDAYVFFGYSAPGLYDLQPTPAGDKYPGVEVHATLLDNLLSRLAMRDVPKGIALPSIALLALVAGVAGTLSRRVWQSLLGFAVFLSIPFLVGFMAYQHRLWWPIMAGETAAALALVGAVVVNYATEGRQKKFLKNAFRYYLGAEVIEQIIADPSRLTLGGEKRVLTIFFSDIEKFSSFSERLDPPVLTALLNDYLSDMSGLIQEEGGYLDKYIGDAIVAFWNAPLDQGDHARRACQAAVRCQRKLAERRPEYERRTGAVVKARIGLNTGAVAVGNMGSYERFNYTILGDAANLASRLEGANKAFGSYILVSESTWEESGGDFVGRELGRLRVVGRKAPVRVYELAGLPGEARPAHFAPFEEALALFYDGDFAQAAARFAQLPEDPASKAYAFQCRSLLENPPAEWDGVLSLTEK